MALCPFCTSGDAWNVCGCRWALVAQRSNLIEARKRFVASGARVSVSARDFQPSAILLVEPVKVEPPKFDKKAWQRAYMVEYRKRKKKEG